MGKSFVSKMVEEQRTRVEEAMTRMVNEVDKLHLRKMQVSFTVFGPCRKILSVACLPFLWFCSN